MSGADFTAILPLLILGAASLPALLFSAFFKKPGASFAVSAAGLILALCAVPYSWASAPRAIGVFLFMDRFSLFAIGLVIAASLVTAAGALSGLEQGHRERGEHFALILLAALGASVMAASQGFPALFLGLELLSVSLFSLISWNTQSIEGSQAGITYLILSGASSAFLLMGAAFVYHAAGSMALSAVAARLGRGAPDPLLVGGIALMAVGIGFKLGVVPFHFWTPDVYAGAPPHVSGFLATASKGAAAVVLVRLFGDQGVSSSIAFTVIFAGIAGASMIIGNLMALRETNVKRILAYSSITHLGYLLIAFLAGGAPAVLTTSFFLAAYFASTLGAFSSVSALSGIQGGTGLLDEYRGLAWKRPWLAACFTVSILSLAGLPFTSGFMGKFMLFAAGEGSSQWVLILLLALNSAVSLAYYLRIISTMFRRPPSAAGAAAAAALPRVPAAAAAAIIIAVLAILALGIYPAPLMNVIETFSAG